MTLGIVCYILMIYGLCNVLVFGSGPFNILLKFKNWASTYCKTIYEMLQCMMCTSTNIGWIMSCINLLFFKNFHFTPATILFDDFSIWYLIIIFDAFFTSGCVWLIHTVQEAFEAIKTYFTNNE